MLKRAVKHDFHARYVLWTAGSQPKIPYSLSEASRTGQRTLFVLFATTANTAIIMKNSTQRRFSKFLKRRKSCRKMNVRYFEAVVYYSDIEERVEVYFVVIPITKALGALSFHR